MCLGQSVPTPSVAWHLGDDDVGDRIEAAAVSRRVGPLSILCTDLLFILHVARN